MFWKSFPEVENELVKTRALLAETLQEGDRFLDLPVTELLRSGGKELRPAFLLLASKWGPEKNKNIFRLAAGAELLHLATLIHDDVVDDAPLRRGNEAVHKAIGKRNAVLLGDYLFSRCLTLAAGAGSPDNTIHLSRIIAFMAGSEIVQNRSRFKLNKSPRNYLKGIMGKTAGLFSLCFYIGIYETKGESHICALFRRIGYNIGMAFQIIDDLLDFQGDKKILGKAAGADLQQGLFTLPVIYGLRDFEAEFASLLKKHPFSDNQVRDIIELCEKKGTMNTCRKLAGLYTERALREIERLPERKEKHTLKNVVVKLLDRVY